MQRRPASFILFIAIVALPSPALALTSLCQLSSSDRAWLDRSVRAWDVARRKLLEAPPPATLESIIFDRECELTSMTAMVGGTPAWRTQRIDGEAVSAGTERIAVGVISATIGDRTGTRFVMSTPTVWSAGGVAPGSLGLETLMSAVLIHEATHVFQMNTYGKQIEALQKAHRLTDEEFNDDAIQARFGKQREFAASVQRETDLFFAAAHAKTDIEAVRLARQARALMQARAERFFTAEQAYQVRAEDLWLTMEGSAQWAGYRWLRMPSFRGGAGASKSRAMSGFGRRGHSWSQLLGLAVALTVDRFPDAAWKQRVFGDGRRTLLELLDERLAKRINKPRSATE